MTAHAPPRPRSAGRLARILAAWGTLVVAGCSTGGIEFGPGTTAPSALPQVQNLPPAQGEIIGAGPVRVALLLPLSGDQSLAGVGASMANAARLAVSFIEQSPTLSDNINIVLKDTGPSAAGAAQAASQAIGEGASLILGPLRADQVTAVGAVARSAGIPVIGFSNNSGAASAGVFLLNVLPEQEVRRSMGFVRAQGKQAFAAIVPTTDFGRIQEGAFRQAVGDLALNARAIYSFSSEAEARNAIAQLAPLVLAGQIDVLFIPDRATAPSFAVLLEEAGVGKDRLQLVGSADWNNDAAIANTPYLAGAVYPAIDDVGFRALSLEYAQRFGGIPHAFSTLAYTAVILANAPALAMGTPRYDRTQLTLPAGFTGRDGVFRFLPDGRSEYALVIKRVTVGGALVVEAARL